jgi:hypothetical protein
MTHYPHWPSRAPSFSKSLAKCMAKASPVADVETLPGAVAPPLAGVELPRVDLLGDPLDDVGATARPVSGAGVGMVSPEPVLQETVHERIDRDHAAANLEPAVPSAWRAS